jgi:cytochrome c oxidase cbb3-type subunit III
MARLLIIAVALYTFVFASAEGFQNTPTAPKRGGNPEAAKMTNPVAGTPDSVAQGRRVYQRLCSRCHGPEGKGDGAAAGAVQPPDLTDDQWDYGSSDGEIYSVIHDGTSNDMEGYAERINDTDIWNLVNYLRSLGPQKKP